LSPFVVIIYAIYSLETILQTVELTYGNATPRRV